MSDISQIPPPEDPEKALSAVVSLRLVADKLEKRAVVEAIKQGWTWAQVAEALGVTRQAAHKKFAGYLKLLGDR